MIVAVTLYQVMEALHVIAVLAAFGAPFAYVFLLPMVRRAEPVQRAWFHSLQANIGKFVISPGLVFILGFGAYLASKEHVWSKAWVTVPLLVLIALGGMGPTYFKTREEKLAELARSGDESGYQALFSQVYAVTCVSVLSICVAIYFMTVKPFA
jgi:uncharacterized membrane protein